MDPAPEPIWEEVRLRFSRDGTWMHEGPMATFRGMVESVHHFPHAAAHLAPYVTMRPMQISFPLPPGFVNIHDMMDIVYPLIDPILAPAAPVPPPVAPVPEVPAPVPAPVPVHRGGPRMMETARKRVATGDARSYRRSFTADAAAPSSRVPVAITDSEDSDDDPDEEVL